MIRAAFDQGLVDEEIINLKSVERIYEQGGEIFEPARPWFEEYSESYLEEHSLQERKASTPQVEFPLAHQLSVVWASVSRGNSPQGPIR